MCCFVMLGFVVCGCVVVRRWSVVLGFVCVCLGVCVCVCVCWGGDDGGGGRGERDTEVTACPV